MRRLHKLGLVVAERLARGEQVYPQLPRGAVRCALEALRDAAIIESRGRGDWRFASPLLRRADDGLHRPLQPTDTAGIAVTIHGLLT